MSDEIDLTNITRFDIEKEGKAGQHGWWVRLQKNRKKFHNFFNDNSFGGKDTGLKAAILFRDAVKTQLEDMTAEKVTHKRPRSNSGVVGVSRYEGPYKTKGHVYQKKFGLRTG